MAGRGRKKGANKEVLRRRSLVVNQREEDLLHGSALRRLYRSSAPNSHQHQPCSPPAPQPAPSIPVQTDDDDEEEIARVKERQERLDADGSTGGNSRVRRNCRCRGNKMSGSPRGGSQKA
jgi:hypothetical protein